MEMRYNLVMILNLKKEWRAVATLVGATIGAGMFGIPYAMSRLGFVPGLIYMFILGGLMLLLNLLYGEVILRTPGDHQLGGYFKEYIGDKASFLRLLNLVAFFISAYGALLAYGAKMGEFAQIILGVGTPTTYSIIFFVIGMVALYFGLRSVSAGELIIVGLIVVSVLVLLIGGAPKIEWQYLGEVEWSYFLLPYGVILFALNGNSVIPEMEEVLRDERKKLKKAIIWGTVIPFLVYIVFSFLVVGDCGPFTSQDALSGMLPILPPWMVKLTAFVGILAMGSSFLTLGYVLKESWMRDHKYSKSVSFVLASVPALILFLLGVRGFVEIIEFSGAVSVGITSLLILLMHKKAKDMGRQESPYSIKLPNFMYRVLQVVFILGALTPFIGRL